MRSLAITDGSDLRVHEADPRPAGAGEVEVDVAYCGVCGSDLHFLNSKSFSDGRVLGHEVAGTVRAVGAGVDDVQVGDRVVLNPFEACGDCRQCTLDRPHLCWPAIEDGLGLGRKPGGYAERVVVPASTVLRIPERLALRHAALVEPLAVGVRGARMALRESGVPILVTGAGPIGVLTAMAAQALGDAPVLITSTNARRAELARSVGLEVTTADAVLAGEVAAFGGLPPRVVIEAAGKVSTAGSAIEMVDPGGLIVLVGAAQEPCPISTHLLVTKELRVLGSFAYDQTDLEDAIELLASGRVDVEPLITGTCDLDGAPDVVRALRTGGSEQMKVLIAPAGTAV